MKTVMLSKMAKRFFSTVKNRRIVAPNDGSGEIHFRNYYEFQDKVDHMSRLPLNVFSDYDNTLTRNYINGVALNDSINVFYDVLSFNYQTPLFPDSLRKLMKEYDAKFMLVFNDHSLTREDKHKKLVPWWKELHKAILSQDMTKEKLRQIIQQSTLTFRNGIIDFLDTLGKYNVPLTVSSAGIMGIIEQSFNLLYENYGIERKTKIVYSGTSEEYEGDKLVKFNEPIITTLNKSSIITHDKCNYIRRKSGGIIMGDLLPDLLITENLELNSLITIGYYRHGEKIDLKEFAKKFDVTILNDGNLSFPVQIINMICS